MEKSVAETVKKIDSIDKGKYCMKSHEIIELMEMVEEDQALAIISAFNLGFLKGGRCARAGKYKESRA
jgi:hypothetical protein